MRVTDAVYSIPEVTGEIVPVPDCDGDGLSDLAIARGGEWSESERVDLMSSKSGALLRTLGKLPKSGERTAPWIAGGDLDGDRFPDLIIGEPDAEDSRGRVTILSGKEGSPVAVIRGGASKERFGASLAFLGDLNGDGLEDFAVGAEEFDPGARPVLPQIVSYQSTSDGTTQQEYVVLAGGSRITQEEFDELILGYRSASGGFVSVRSGRDRSELWRASGQHAGHAFGSFARPIGDLDKDGKVDFLVGSDLRAPDPLRLLSGADGKEIARMKHRGAWAGPVGDLDGDGVTDLFQDTGSSGCVRLIKVDFLSGTTRKSLFTLRYPDMCSDHGITVAMGDLDGDGIGDIGLGDGNFNLLGPGDPGFAGNETNLSKFSLADALSLDSEPWCAFTWESGCAVVYSGRTREVIFGVWAEPGSREGLGVGLSPLPDFTGDGWPDVMVANGTTAYAFRGPGPEPK